MFVYAEVPATKDYDGLVYDSTYAVFKSGDALKPLADY
jgi:hypothetical protein